MNPSALMLLIFVLMLYLSGRFALVFCLNKINKESLFISGNYSKKREFKIPLFKRNGITGMENYLLHLIELCAISRKKNI